MKINTNYLIVFVVFVFVLLMSLGCSCSKVSPYHKDNLFPRYFNYEGFAPLSPAEFDNSNLLHANTVTKPVVKVEGFEGLLSSPYGENMMIDIYSQAKGSPTCAPSTYSNSTGYLCMDEKQKQLLTTRGGNSTGKDSEIGK
jgi:hypothetical protein